VQWVARSGLVTRTPATASASERARGDGLGSCLAGTCMSAVERWIARVGSVGKGRMGHELVIWPRKRRKHFFSFFQFNFQLVKFDSNIYFEFPISIAQLKSQYDYDSYCLK
jgi:hypothetical protein